MPVNHNEIADKIMGEHKIITFTDTRESFFWSHISGIYEPADILIDELVQRELGEDTKTHIVNEVKESIKRQTYLDREKVGTRLELIPLKNCVYNMNTDKVEAYSPEVIFLAKHEVEKCDNELLGTNPIDKFLEEITNSHEDCLLLKEMVGYCFYRSTPFQNFFMLVGRGSNGKSVYLNILKKMIGDNNYSTMSLQTLSEGGFELSYLYNKSANLIGDLPRKAFQDVGHIKELTGGDTITAKQKFKNPIKFRNFAKLISACNEVPETPDTTDGFFRRAILINFPFSFEGRENRNLFEEITTPENMWDFFKTSVNAFKLALENNNFIRVETIESKKDKYMVYSNSAAAFCYAELEFDPEAQIASEEIYKRYVDWCKEKRTAAKDEIRFFKSLYTHFGNKAWKKRLTDERARIYVIQGVFWKMEVARGPLSD